MGSGARDPAHRQFTDDCFTGDYPTGRPDQTGSRPSCGRPSLLAEPGQARDTDLAATWRDGPAPPPCLRALRSMVRDADDEGGGHRVGRNADDRGIGPTGQRQAELA